MLKSTKLLCSLFLVLLAAAAVPAAHADTLTYAFDYTGYGVLSEAQGSGTFSYDSSTRDVTAFTFADTFYNVTLFGLQKAATFAYSGTQDINYQGMLLFADGTLAGIDITTIFKSALTGGGQANFSFNYAIGAALDGSAGTRLGENTAGSGSVRLVSDIPGVAATPEPSSLMLLGTGILGIAGVARRKFCA